MANKETDLWPDDIRTQDVLSPEEILKQQSDSLCERTNALLSAEIVREEQPDRMLLRFEVVPARVHTRSSLFAVLKRKEFDYPAAFILPDTELPDYLADEVYRPSIGDVMEFTKKIGNLGTLMGEGGWEKNEWVAATPIEFRELLKKILGMPVVRATVVSLLGEAKRRSEES